MKLLLNERGEYYQSWPGSKNDDATLNQELKKVCEQVYVLNRGKIDFADQGNLNKNLKKIISFAGGDSLILGIHFGKGDEDRKVLNFINTHLEGTTMALSYSIGLNTPLDSLAGQPEYQQIWKQLTDDNKKKAACTQLLEAFGIKQEEKQVESKTSFMEELQVTIGALVLLIKVRQKASEAADTILARIEATLSAVQEIMLKLEPVAAKNDFMEKLNNELKELVRTEGHADEMKQKCEQLIKIMDDIKEKIRDCMKPGARAG